MNSKQLLIALLILVVATACGRTDFFDRSVFDTSDDSGVTDQDMDMGGDSGDESDLGDMSDASQMDADMGSCDNGIRDGDETGVDCGGEFCAPCACEIDSDCNPDQYCESGECLLKKPTGEICDRGPECRGEICEIFDEPICTETCTTECPEGFSCFGGLCTPDDYCDRTVSPPEGPGCTGTICDLCDSNATCVQPENGEDYCECNSGFEGNGQTCTDIDECVVLTERCPDNSICSNFPGGYECRCEPGYEFDDTGRCVDVNECAAGTDDCDPNASCTNNPGGWTCTCNQGWQGPGDICFDVDECSGMPCGSNSTCVNEPGSYRCECAAGFVYDPSVADCVDIDECQNDPCDANATCTNQPGSFDCSCNVGYDGNGFMCTDIDECASMPCDSNATCTNEPGSFSCACNAGYTGDGFMCTPVASCASDPTICDPNATCQMGACVCDAGYRGDGFMCTDIDECATNPCGTNEICTNEPGSFSCACAAGTVEVDGVCRFEGDVCGGGFPVNSLPFFGNGNTSTSTNDYFASASACPGILFGERGNSSPDDVWEFTPTQSGTYTIDVDDQGFIASAYVVTDCSDIANNCLAGDTFEPSLEVAMTAGTTYYIVVDGGSNFSTQAGPYAIEIQLNECASGLANCDANATCNDTPIGFTCSCNTGYTGSGQTCTNVDECALNIDNCDANATCTDTDGSFDCTCNSGYSGDGVNCWDPAATGESCIAPFQLPAVPITVTGDTSNANNDHSVSNGYCSGIFSGGAGSRDEVWSWTPSTTQQVTITLQASHATAMWVTSDCTDLQNACLAGDTGFGGFNDAEVTVTLNAGTTYFIVVDGLSNTMDRSGPYQLTVQ